MSTDASTLAALRERPRVPLFSAFAVATVATAGSLYYQFGLGYFPCQLCWFQRVLMYPLVVVLGYAALTDFDDAHRLVAPFPLIGAPISAYHSYLQTTPGITCSFGPCGYVQHRVLGLSIPNQALVAFVLVGLAMVAHWRLR